MKTKELNIGKLVRTSLLCSVMAGLVACGGNEVAENEGMEETTAMETEVADATDWDNERFGTSFTSTGRFGGWDANDDNMLDENEFYGSYYDTWDVNNDNMLDEDEWNNASRDFGMEGQNWSDWDTNKDNNLDENEFRTGAANSNYYRDWDRNSDNMLDENEYSEGVFGLWDDDDDGMITNDQYTTRYNRYYGGTVE